MTLDLGIEEEDKTLARMLHEARESREVEAEQEEPYVVTQHYLEQDNTYFDGVPRRDYLTWLGLGGWRT